MRQLKNSLSVRAALRRSSALALRAESALRSGYSRLWKRLGPAPVAVYRKKHVLTVANAPSIGGAVYLITLVGEPLLTLSREGSTVQVGTTVQVARGRGNPLLITYADEMTAEIALGQVRRALLPVSWSTVGRRAAAVVVLAFVCNAMLTAMWGQPTATAKAEVEPLQGMAAALADPAYQPPEALPQALPGGTAMPVNTELALQQALGELLPGVDFASLQNTPETRAMLAAAESRLAGGRALPVAASEVAPGLGAFGLTGGPGETGPGCDPGLAY
ncbi:MAG: hypothetical protein ACREPE_13795, partial [Lysobacter sp.]